ncbi:MAG: hypothetical protein IPM24_28375 [Bryobacterales bacterium]|nr:hypothetical protein [Bryobacterales bacterium]
MWRHLAAQQAEGAGDLALDDGGVLLETLQKPAAGGVPGPGFGQDAAGDLVVLGGVVGGEADCPRSSGTPR